MLRIDLWVNESDNAKAPIYKGLVTLPDGTKERVCVWSNEGAENPKAPALKGKTAKSASSETFNNEEANVSIPEGSAA